VGVASRRPKGGIGTGRLLLLLLLGLGCDFWRPVHRLTDLL
jgi:hypothetical protein